MVEDDFPALLRLLRQRELDAVVVELDSMTAGQRSLSAGMIEEPLLDEPWKLVVPTGALLTTENIDLGICRFPGLALSPRPPTLQCSAGSVSQRMPDWKRCISTRKR